MKLEHENLEDLKRKILEIVGRHVDLKTHRVFFFGSRVNGRSTEHSDIDIGIEGQAPIDGSRLRVIRFEFEELPILYKIDIIDFADVSEKFKAVAKQDVEYIN